MEVEVTFLSLSARHSDGEVKTKVTFEAPASELPKALRAQAYLLGKPVPVTVSGKSGTAVLRSVVVSEDHSSSWLLECDLDWALGWVGDAAGRTLTLEFDIKKVSARAGADS